MPSDGTKPGGTPQPGFLSSPAARVETLTKRADFLRCARGLRQHSTSFVIQGWNRHDTAPPRVGFTCSKKVGNAVARNRAKRRLREIARTVLPTHGQPGWDYVLIGRADITATTPMPSMVQELELALIAMRAKTGRAKTS